MSYTAESAMSNPQKSAPVNTIGMEIEGLKNALDELQKMVGDLEGKMQPFLRPSPPVPMMFEDELPEDITDADYDEWYKQSHVPDGVGCRMGPKLVRG